MKKFTFVQIKKKLKDLSNKGWIKSNRLHNTGIGKTIEDYLGITENNIALPDFGVMELKAQRRETGSMVTLFTRKPDTGLNSKLLDKFGYPRPTDGKKVLHQTVTRVANKQGYRLVDNKKDSELIVFKHKSLVVSYDRTKLEDSFIKKVGRGVILVLAEAKKDNNGKEQFAYKEAYLCKGGNFDRFIAKMKYDIRMGRYPDGRPHDHGSAFRLPLKDFKEVFSTFRKLI
ncbi:MAG: MvaI/BcnI family restriction endonuclease [Patescibacteria group bacterium]